MAPKSKKRSASNQELYQMLQEVVSPLKDGIAALDKKVDLHIQRTEFGFESVAKLDEQQNALLKEHHDRSVQLKKDNELREATLRQEIEAKDEAVNSRLEILEAPRKWLRSTWALFLAGGAAAGVIVAVLEMLGKR